MNRRNLCSHATCYAVIPAVFESFYGCAVTTHKYAIVPRACSSFSIMDATSITDNTTVVAGPSSAVNRKDLSHHQYDFVKPEHAPLSSTQAPYPKAQNEFGRAADVTMADRQFFVTIGHDGLIGALQKLDRELQNVSVSQNLRFPNTKKVTVWQK